ncbi:hypothetical protein MHC_04120 [Mycoplasma haemocanis str. Illinois]|uniref:Uncharacterized protein n=1 Tax=Mycoplasma haemocanis (strain Illinois) TaxID=1111676 RepID=H6N7Q8_MYCHN|nr:hypothetical protein [Mycoplasma haemocanis]AEW45680.1 hypothetical protein MHC_04120 [Mycoplasma haemocanis str. Illinois]
MSSKSLMLSLGGLGAGGVGLGGLLVMKSWASKKETFSDKYKHSLLDDFKDDVIWGRKYVALKTTKPTHPKLMRAYIEATKKPTENEQEAKILLKAGCKDIYESPFEDSKYQNDFKSYCSLTNLDVSSNQTWNSETTDKTPNNKWDTSLGALKNHDIKAKGNLVETLETLKSLIQGKDTFEKENRDSLKGWFDAVKAEIFMGSDSTEFKNQELYCKGS